MDPHIDGVVPQPMTDAEKDFLNGPLLGRMLEILRRIHAAYDEDGHDLSGWPAMAADEIEHLRREAYAWSKACEAATTKLYKLSTHHPRLEIRYWTGEWWEPLYGTRFHEVLDTLELTQNVNCASNGTNNERTDK